MRFYGIPSESRVFEIIENIQDGFWIFEDTQTNAKERLSHQEVKERLRELISQVQGWKESNSFIPQNTTFVFVHEPSEPKAFKIYDMSSLGCSSNLFPPRWKVYKEGIEL